MTFVVVGACSHNDMSGLLPPSIDAPLNVDVGILAPFDIEFVFEGRRFILLDFLIISSQYANRSMQTALN